MASHETLEQCSNLQARNNAMIMVMFKWILALISAGVLGSIGMVVVAAFLAIVPPILGIDHFHYWYWQKVAALVIIVIIMIAIIRHKSAKTDG